MKNHASKDPSADDFETLVDCLRRSLKIEPLPKAECIASVVPATGGIQMAAVLEPLTLERKFRMGKGHVMELISDVVVSFCDVRGWTSSVENSREDVAILLVRSPSEVTRVELRQFYESDEFYLTLTASLVDKTR